MEFMEAHLAKHKWFSGEHITLADFQMSFAVEAVLSRTQGTEKHPHLVAYRQRLNERPAYQRAIAKGGPVVL
jgi:glutathione S-transferase